MIKVLTTAEAAEKTGLTDRSIRRRLDNELAPRVTIQNGNRTTYGVTETSVKTYIKNQKTKTVN